MAGEKDFLISDELNGNVDLTTAEDISDRVVIVALKYEGAEGRFLMGSLQFLKIDGSTVEIEVRLDRDTCFSELRELESGLRNVDVLEVSHNDTPSLVRNAVMVSSYQLNGLDIETVDALLSLKLVPQTQEKLLRG